MDARSAGCGAEEDEPEWVEDAVEVIPEEELAAAAARARRGRAQTRRPSVAQDLELVSSLLHTILPSAGQRRVPMGTRRPSMVPNGAEGEGGASDSDDSDDARSPRDGDGGDGAAIPAHAKADEDEDRFLLADLRDKLTLLPSLQGSGGARRVSLAGVERLQETEVAATHYATEPAPGSPREAGRRQLHRASMPVLFPRTFRSAPRSGREACEDGAALSARSTPAGGQEESHSAPGDAPAVARYARTLTPLERAKPSEVIGVMDALHRLSRLQAGKLRKASLNTLPSCANSEGSGGAGSVANHSGSSSSDEDEYGDDDQYLQSAQELPEGGIAALYEYVVGYMAANSEPASPHVFGRRVSLVDGMDAASAANASSGAVLPDGCVRGKMLVTQDEDSGDDGGSSGERSPAFFRSENTSSPMLDEMLSGELPDLTAK